MPAGNEWAGVVGSVIREERSCGTRSFNIPSSLPHGHWFRYTVNRKLICRAGGAAAILSDLERDPPQLPVVVTLG